MLRLKVFRKRQPARMGFSPERQLQLIMGNHNELRLLVSNADIHAKPRA